VIDIVKRLREAHESSDEDVQRDLQKLFDRQSTAAEVEDLCRRIGPARVIGIAREYAIRKEREAQIAYEKSRAEALRAFEGPKT